MSLRRQSCDSCFRARRKCDLMYPVCTRCQRNSKRCHYVYHPQLDVVGTIVTGSTSATASSDSVSDPGQPKRTRNRHEPWLQLSQAETLQPDQLQLRRQSVTRVLSRLGELQPVSGTSSWKWLVDQIRGYPLAFATETETLFIHKSLYRNSFPQPLRAAFSICAGCLYMNERNRSVLFQALDAEASELFTPALTSTLLEDLVRLQAIVLFQIIRLFYGDIEQRIVAERQEYMVRSYGLRLLHRAEAELRGAQGMWETWILAESIRRTVVIAFKLYTVYSNFQYGVRAELASVKILPVSTKPGSWNSREVYLQDPDRDETMRYVDFTLLWSAFPRKTLEPFEKFVLVGCKGIGQIEDPLVLRVE